MKMKIWINDTLIKTMAAVLVLLKGQIVYSQPPQGHYEGALTRDGSVQLVSFNFMQIKQRTIYLKLDTWMFLQTKYPGIKTP